MKVHGETVEERVVWASLFVPGANGRRGVPLLLVGDPGCLAGDTEINVNRGGKGFRIGIRELVAKQAGAIPGGNRWAGIWDSNIQTMVARAVNGVVRLAPMANAWASGVKETFVLRTMVDLAMREIRASADHPFFVGDSFVRLTDLRVGDRVAVNAGLSKGMSQRSLGTRVSYRERRTFFHPHQRPKWTRTGGEDKFRVPEHRLAFEANMNGIPLEEFLWVLRTDAVAAGSLQYLDPGMIVHHLDENPLNNAPSNLRAMTVQEHASLHSEEAARHVQQRIGFETITHIERVAEEETFDIEVEGDPHCFLANGFVVHNTAKTSRIQQLAKQAGLHFEGVLASLRQPHDFLGMPWLTADKETLYAPPRFALNAAKHNPAVVLLDEVTTCPPAVQAALLRLLFEGVCGDLELPNGVRFLLACNKPEQAAGGYDLAMPLVNRIGIIQWEAPDLNRFLAHLGGSNEEVTPINAGDLEAAVDKAWPAVYAATMGEVAGFLRSMPNRLHCPPKPGEEIKAWPSARSWELATRLLAGCKVMGLGDQERHVAVAAFVGDGVAGELHAWRRGADLPDAEQWLDGKLEVKIDERRIDRTAAILDGGCALILATKDEALQKTRVARFWDLVAGFPDMVIDVAAPTADQLMKAKLCFKHGGSKAVKKLEKLFPQAVSA